MNETTTWYDDMSDAAMDRLGKEINSQEFDHVFQVTRRGIADGPDGIYAPEVENDDEHDILVDGVPLKATTSKGWQALEGYTCQYGYAGAVMQPSEFVGGLLAEDIIRISAESEAEGTPLVWTMTSAHCGDDPENPAGWVVLARRLT